MTFEELKDKALSLPLEPGVYLMQDKSGQIIYVGKAKKLKNRVSQYFQNTAAHTPKTRKMVSQIDHFDVIVAASEFEALVLECSLIKRHMPKYNILLKDDKGYHYVRISPPPYSRIQECKKKQDDGARYLGPYVSSYTVKQAVDEANKIFLLPTCNRTFAYGVCKERPCLNHYIQQCCAPCTGRLKEADYNERVEQAVEFLTQGSAKTLALLGKPDDAANISQKMIDYGLSNVRLYIGADLKQPDEQIISGSPADFLEQTFSALSLIYIENPDAEPLPVTYGLSDDAFIRGKVPMTKSEIRSVVLSKLKLTKNAILFDIGAGTGSIAIEAARQIPDGRVYAIERNPDGLDLIKENSLRLQADNLTIVSGTAPESLDALPAATHAFIGGSAGHLKEILQLLYSRNPEIRVVITAITLETIGQIMALQKEMALPEPEIIQIQVSSAKKAGPYHLMQGQNPVYIVSF